MRRLHQILFAKHLRSLILLFDISFLKVIDNFNYLLTSVIYWELYRRNKLCVPSMVWSWWKDHELFKNCAWTEFMNSSWMVLEHEMVLFMKSSWTFQGTEFSNCSWTCQCTGFMNSSGVVLEHEMILFVKLQQYMNTSRILQMNSSWTFDAVHIEPLFIYIWRVFHLWRSFEPFSLSCAQK